MGFTTSCSAILVSEGYSKWTKRLVSPIVQLKIGKIKFANTAKVF